MIYVFANLCFPCIQLGINDGNIGDNFFLEGMLQDSAALGDQGTTSSGNTFSPDWVPAFKQDIHGVVLISGDCHSTVAETLAEVEKIFLVGSHNATIHEVIRIVGDVRPGKEAGHEQFVSLYLVQDLPTADFQL